MMRMAGCVLLGCMIVSSVLRAEDAPAGEGFVEIFNGKDLAGWKAEGQAEWLVEDGCLVGTQTTGKGGDSFTEKEWDNFELVATYKMKWPGNSGFWFRWNGKAGYQFDVLKYRNPLAYSGSLYCHGKMFLTRNLDESIENKDGWNEVRIWANGGHIIMDLNGKRVSDVQDKTFAKGKFGIQVHGGNEFKGMKMTVKRIAVRPLKADEKPPASQPSK